MNRVIPSLFLEESAAEEALHALGWETEQYVYTGGGGKDPVTTITLLRGTERLTLGLRLEVLRGGTEQGGETWLKPSF